MEKEIDIEKLKEIVPIELGKRVNYLRQKNGMSQIQLGRQIGNDRQYVNKIEKGKINPTLIKLLSISEALNVSLKELLEITY